MSLRKNINEIKRLISAFEKEADKFHDLRFSVYYIAGPGSVDDTLFEKSNHAIMLWQYYGKIKGTEGSTNLLNDLKGSNMKWGLRGSEVTSFGVIEGEACKQFVRMAKRAGSIFNEKETRIIKSRVLNEIVEQEKGGNAKPVSVVNDNPLSIWLNFLLYHISMVKPGSEKLKRIEPDPFSLSLLALERLIEKPIIEKIDKSITRIDDINFKVALSFPGERRPYVSKVAEFIKEELGKDSVFYDYDYLSQLASVDLDIKLQKVYRDNAELIVVFLCQEYTEKEWCRLEWRAVRDIIKSRDKGKVMFVRFDNANVDGIFSIDGYIDGDTFSEKEVSKFILERVSLSV